MTIQAVGGLLSGYRLIAHRFPSQLNASAEQQQLPAKAIPLGKCHRA